MSCARGPSARIFSPRCDTTTTELLGFAVGLQSWDSGRLIRASWEGRRPNLTWFGPFLRQRRALKGRKRRAIKAPPIEKYRSERHGSDVRPLDQSPRTTYKKFRLLRPLEKKILQKKHSDQRVLEALSLTASVWILWEKRKKKKKDDFGDFFFYRLSFSGSGGPSVANLVALGSKVAAWRRSGQP